MDRNGKGSSLQTVFWHDIEVESNLIPSAVSFSFVASLELMPRLLLFVLVFLAIFAIISVRASFGHSVSNSSTIGFSIEMDTTSPDLRRCARLRSSMDRRFLDLADKNLPTNSDWEASPPVVQPERFGRTIYSSAR